MSKLDKNKDEIIAYYKDNLSCASIGEIYNVSSSTVRTFLLKNNIELRKPTVNKKSICDDYKEKILEMYNNEKLSVLEISEKLNISKSTIYASLERWGNDRRDFSEMNKTILNEDFFNCIDSSEKAYWLGFMYADGYVTGDYVGIALHSKDREHLIKFKTAIESNGNINDYNSKTTPYSRIYFKSEKMVNDLINKGCFRNKSLVLKFPTEKQVPKEYQSHFIRGYFDGDGCLSINLSKQSYRFSILGTKEFLTTIADIFKNGIDEDFSCNLSKRKKDDTNNYTLRYGGINRTYKIMNYLYKDSSEKIYLQRKYENYQTLNKTIVERIRNGAC